MIRHTWIVKVRRIGDPESLSLSTREYKFASRADAETAIARCVKFEQEFGARVWEGSGGWAFNRSGRNGEVSVFFGIEQRTEVLDTCIDLGLDVLLDEEHDDEMTDPDF